MWKMAYGGGLHNSKGNEIGLNFFILNLTHGGGGGGSPTISTRKLFTPLIAI